jgi:hypothetical protein
MTAPPLSPVRLAPQDLYGFQSRGSGAARVHRPECQVPHLYNSIEIPPVVLLSTHVSR